MDLDTLRFFAFVHVDVAYPERLQKKLERQGYSLPFISISRNIFRHIDLFSWRCERFVIRENRFSHVKRFWQIRFRRFAFFSFFSSLCCTHSACAKRNARIGHKCIFPAFAVCRLQYILYNNDSYSLLQSLIHNNGVYLRFIIDLLLIWRAFRSRSLPPGPHNQDKSANILPCITNDCDWCV